MGPRALAILAASFYAAAAQADCTCRFAGEDFALGTIACIQTNEGPKLARCDMSQNVTSWTFSRDGCEVSLIIPPPPDADLHPVSLTATGSDRKDSRED